jgi:hypothetical protein
MAASTHPGSYPPDDMVGLSIQISKSWTERDIGLKNRRVEQLRMTSTQGIASEVCVEVAVLG